MEVTLAIGVTAFCLVSIFSLFPISLNSTQNSIQQSEAANLILAIVSDIRSAPKTTASKSPLYKIPIPNQPSVDRTIPAPIYLNEDASIATQAGNAKYRVTLSFGAASGQSATPLHILVTWPAPADPAIASGRLETITLLDRAAL